MKLAASIRKTLKRLCTEYDLIVIPVLRFLAALLFLVLLRNYIGCSEAACRPLVILLLSAVCIFFPSGCITLVCTGFILANMAAASLSLALLGGFLAFLVVMLYFGFRPGNGLFILLIPMGFLLKIPYAVPVILGLSAGLTAAVPAAFGTVFWFLLKNFHDGVGTAETGTRLEALLSGFVSESEALFKNEELFLTLLAFVLCIAVVHFLSRLSFHHSWTVSVLAGLFALAAVMGAGSIFLGVGDGIPAVLLRTAAALPLVLLYELFFYGVDYRSTEHLQFEDDEYYYYVKAVPKIGTEDEEERRD